MSLLGRLLYAPHSDLIASPKTQPSIRSFLNSICKTKINNLIFF